MSLNNASLGASPDVSVVVCVRDALPDVTACLASLRNSDSSAARMKITLVDDASGRDTARFLDGFAAEAGADLIRHDTPRGYTNAANAGIENRGEAAYVVLLNSDTIVPSAWLSRLLEPFRAMPDLGIAGPLSSAATWQSIPEIRGEQGGWAVNQLPGGWTVDRMDTLVHGLFQARTRFPRVPVLNGFCLMIRAELFERVGLLDAERFPRGYGEENDFCFRASDAGYGMVVAANCYVYHGKSKSFGADIRNQLAQDGKRHLAEKYSKGRLDRASETMKQHPALADIRARVRQLLADESPPPSAVPLAATTSGAGSKAMPSIKKRQSHASSVNAAIKQMLEGGAKGVQSIDDKVAIEILESRSTKHHTHIKGAYPEGATIEESFTAGPVFVVCARDAVVDTQAGLTLLDGGVVRATTVTQRLSSQYQYHGRDVSAAKRAEEDALVPLASQRMGNYCRWWLDSVAKLFVVGNAQLLENVGGQRGARNLAPNLTMSFQRETRDLLDRRYRFEKAPAEFLRGSIVNSSGLCFGGGQRIGGSVNNFAEFLGEVPIHASVYSDFSPLVYISRSDSNLRKVVNEEEIIPGLRDLGFTIVSPGDLPLTDQIAVMRQARLVVAPHGAGLTNILFCRPGATLVEIFPEGGVHGSAFVRIASHRAFNYYFFVADRVGDAPKDNPNNADMRIDKDAIIGFLKEVLAEVDHERGDNDAPRVRQSQ